MQKPEKIKKILALYKGAKTEGEREAALGRLNFLCEKYELNLEDVLHEPSEEDELKEWTFRAGGKNKSDIFSGLYNFLLSHRGDLKYYKQKGPREFVFKITHSEYIELMEYWEYYKWAYETELDTLGIAFQIKHNLYSPDSEPMTQKQWDALSYEEKQRIARANNQSDGLTIESYNKRKKLEE